MYQYKNEIPEHILENMKKYVDEETFLMLDKLINDAIRIVIYNIIKKYKEDNEIEIALEKVRNNTIYFMALVLMQLIEFGKGENEGPFIDIMDELLKQRIEIV